MILINKDLAKVLPPPGEGTCWAAKLLIMGVRTEWQI